ncbi:DUF2171 domain-containing protein [Sphingomonas sp. LB-2]|uniref:DUF2171 domain-containing protein n=1 Tax=Sphingomonas caeni TaxID=2984949 RepID=UPI002232009F|nr:DUF2171 domain-containing protein [Sphingomonas caeni]MCW3846041.1 DUF2171 domain-containing protein [Sphingomonas caeni]
MDDRTPGYGTGHLYYGPHDQEQLAGPQPGRTSGYSSARDYAAAGEFGSDWRREPRGRDAYGQRGDYHGERYRYDDGRHDRRGDPDRGFFDRAGDEVRSWFGDDEAERRRQRDLRYDAQREQDSHYGAWRRERIAELDRDYDEYRRENAERFHREFTGWRTERQGQREGLGRVSENMEVIGSDGTRIGAVDKVRGDRIILNRNDPDSGGHHHSIPSRWIQSVDDKVTLRKTADEAKAAWKDEERGAFFGGDRDESRGPHILNRSFSGTY